MVRAFWSFLAMTSAIAGTMLFMIGNQTDWLPEALGRISGTGCFMASGLFWMMYGLSYRRHQDSNRANSINKV